MLKASPTQSVESLPLSVDMVGDIEVADSDGGSNKTVKKLPPYTKPTIKAIDYLTPNSKVAFNQLKKAFIKAPIFCHFDPEYHIRIEIDASGYTIGGVLSQLILDNLGQWYLVTYFSKKKISTKPWYKTYKGKLLAIIKTLKIWQYYLKGCKYKVLVFTNYNNFCRFINIKSPSSC